MSWYKKIQAATLPLSDLTKAIRGTLKNMIPGISNVKLDYIFLNQEEGKPNLTVIESVSNFWSQKFPKYPIHYSLYLYARYEYGAQNFETDKPSKGVSYTVHFGPNMQWTLAALDKFPEYRHRILSLIEDYKLASRNGVDILYEDYADSLYEAAIKILDFMNRFESRLDGGDDDDREEFDPSSPKGGKEIDPSPSEEDNEVDPWFPGDPSADWEFEQEQDSLVPVRKKF